MPIPEPTAAQLLAELLSEREAVIERVFFLQKRLRELKPAIADAKRAVRDEPAAQAPAAGRA